MINQYIADKETNKLEQVGLSLAEIFAKKKNRLDELFTDLYHAIEDEITHDEELAPTVSTLSEENLTELVYDLITSSLLGRAVDFADINKD